nr:MAG TPA: hypothetical protein [Caudoviricetes sp.]
MVLRVVFRIIHTINCSYHMPSYGERHSQYISIRFATCSDSERVTAYALYQIEDYTTLKLCVIALYRSF